MDRFVRTSSLTVSELNREIIYFYDGYDYFFSNNKESLRKLHSIDNFAQEFRIDELLDNFKPGSGIDRDKYFVLLASYLDTVYPILSVFVRKERELGVTQANMNQAFELLNYSNRLKRVAAFINRDFIILNDLVNTLGLVNNYLDGRSIETSHEMRIDDFLDMQLNGGQGLKYFYEVFKNTYEPELEARMADNRVRASVKNELDGALLKLREGMADLEVQFMLEDSHE